MKVTRYIFSFLLVVISLAEVKAQTYSSVVLGLDQSLVKVKEGSDPNLIGSPFLTKEWAAGKVAFENGQSGSADKLNYDVLTGVLVMQKDNQEYLFNDPVKEFVLQSLGGERVFRKIGDGFYEVLYDGKTKLLKKYVKTILESSTYGSPTINRKIEDETQMFLVGADQVPQRIKNENALLSSSLSDKATQLKAYMKTNKFNFKREEDLVKLFKYYDSL